jgi:hypothetical protein
MTTTAEPLKKEKENGPAIPVNKASGGIGKKAFSLTVVLAKAAEIASDMEVDYKLAKDQLSRLKNTAAASNEAWKKKLEVQTAAHDKHVKELTLKQATFIEHLHNANRDRVDRESMLLRTKLQQTELTLARFKEKGPQQAHPEAYDPTPFLPPIPHKVLNAPTDVEGMMGHMCFACQRINYYPTMWDCIPCHYICRECITDRASRGENYHYGAHVPTRPACTKCTVPQVPEKVCFGCGIGSCSLKCSVGEGGIQIGKSGKVYLCAFCSSTAEGVKAYRRMLTPKREIFYVSQQGLRLHLNEAVQTQEQAMDCLTKLIEAHRTTPDPDPEPVAGGSGG